MASQRRPIAQIVHDAKLLEKPESRVSAMERHMVIIRTRMQLCFKECGAIGALVMFPHDNPNPQLFVHSFLREFFSGATLSSIKEVIDAAFAKERTFQTKWKSFKESPLSFLTKKTICSSWMATLKRRYNLPDYKTTRDWPVNWGPENVPYTSPSHMRASDKTEKGLWVDLLLERIVRNFPKKELNDALAISKTLKVEDILIVRSLLDQYSPDDLPKLKRSRLNTHHKVVEHRDQQAKDEIEGYWEAQGIALTSTILNGDVVHLGQLANCVRDLGGGGEVTEKKKWGSVASSLGISKDFKNRGNRLRKLWELEVAPAENPVEASQQENAQAGVNHPTLNSFPVEASQQENAQAGVNYHTLNSFPVEVFQQENAQPGVNHPSLNSFPRAPF
ncbi:hypothetical protein BSKO_02756 [Bryopsis sp. KO-2023]|nr:hypothetical protein BSKO_02058 [Bryopsis sp. KO-2023]GMH34895.1 hypothetical protein BSKO_02756 [Bryopsis sp. KO-2023]